MAARFRNEAKGIGQSLQQSLSSFGFAGTLGGALLTKASVDAASDLNESMSKVNVVFKDGAQDVENWSRTSATALGLSQQAALEAAGTFGNFLISMGLIPDEAQKMSVAMVQLAADLASFNNTSPEDALIAIRSGLAGEIEPLRRYGVALSANRVEQEGMAQGINKTQAEMTAAEKATLSYQIILKDTALAQGDFSRTSDGLANQQRILSARLKDAEARLGAALIPLLLTGAKAATALGHGLAVVNDATDGWLGSLAGAAAVGGGVFLVVTKIGSGLGRLVNLFKTQAVVTETLTAAQATNATVAGASAVAQGELAVASGAAGAAMQGEAASAGILSTRLKGLAPILAGLAVGFLAGKKAGEEINKMITGATPKVDELTASLLSLEQGQKDAFDFSKFADDLRGQVNIGDKSGPGEAAKEFFGAFTKNAHQAKADIGPLNDALKSVIQTEGVDTATRAYGLMVQGFRDLKVPIETITGDFAPFQAALDLANVKEKRVKATTDQLSASFKDLAGSFAKESATLSIADALDAAKTAQDELTELKLDAAGKGQRSIDAANQERQAQQSLTDAFRSQASAAANLQDAKRKLAQFEGPTDSRIRQLEREQITSRIVTTPEEARQKEIDILRFDEDTSNRRADLQKQIAQGEEGVRSATEQVGKAQQAVSVAAAARRQVQVDAADAIAGAERQAEEALLNAAGMIVKAKDEQLIGNTALEAYLTLLDGMADRLNPNSPLSHRLDTFLAKLRGQKANQQAFAVSLQFATPGVQFPNPPQPIPPAPVATGGAPNVDFHPNYNITAPDQPTRSTLQTIDRKQAIHLASSGVR